MWPFLYSWCTDMSEQCSTSQFAQFFRDYFMESSLCIELFLIGIIISLLLCSTYYLVIGNFSFTLSKRITWFITLVLSSIIAFFVSDVYVIGTDTGQLEGSTGVYSSSYRSEAELVQSKKAKGDEAKRIRKSAQEYRNLFREDNVDLPHVMSLVNSFYSFVSFFLFSWGMKRFSIHAKFIPF